MQEQVMLQIIPVKNNIKEMCTFTDCLEDMHNTQVDNAKYIDVVMQMYNSIE